MKWIFLFLDNLKRHQNCKTFTLCVCDFIPFSWTSKPDHLVLHLSCLCPNKQNIKVLPLVLPSELVLMVIEIFIADKSGPSDELVYFIGNNYQQWCVFIFCDAYESALWQCRIVSRGNHFWSFHSSSSLERLHNLNHHGLPAQPTPPEALLGSYAHPRPPQAGQ